MVAYNLDIPDAPNNPSVDQPKMKENTNSINTLISVDHIGFNATDGGYHTIIHQKPTSDPAIVPSVGQTYVKTANADQNLFYRSGVGTISQLTGLASSFGSSGYATLPGGLIIQWGTNTCASGTTITFPIAFPTSIFSVQTTITQNTTNRHFVYVRSSTTANFVTTQLDSGGVAESNTFSWIAIGK